MSEVVKSYDRQYLYTRISTLSQPAEDVQLASPIRQLREPLQSTVPASTLDVWQ